MDELVKCIDCNSVIKYIETFAYQKNGRRYQPLCVNCYKHRESGGKPPPIIIKVDSLKLQMQKLFSDAIHKRKIVLVKSSTDESVPDQGPIEGDTTDG